MILHNPPGTLRIRPSVYVVLAFIALLVSGCASQEPAVSPNQTTPTLTVTPSPPLSTPTPAGTDSTQDLLDQLGISGLAELAPTRTPAPTATPDALAEGVVQLLEELGLTRRKALFLQYADWINLAISLALVVAGYLIGTWLIHWLLPRLVKRTRTHIDDRLLATAGNQVRWLAVLLLLQAATNRLTFIQAGIKTFLLDLYFLLVLWLAISLLWRLTRLAAVEAETQARKTGNYEQSESLITLSVWILRMVVGILGLSLLLSHFGINITGFAIFLGIITLVISLAGRDVLADMISGVIILLDRPYRIGDRIDLPGLNTWGNVVDIGVRSTRVLALNNRLVFLPNSTIGKENIVNYSLPDPSYFDSVKVAVAYDNDFDQIVQLLIETVKSVEGVQNEREIDALMMDLTEYSVIFLVGWWLKTYDDYFVVRDRTNRAIIKALNEAGVKLPYARSSIAWKGGQTNADALGGLAPVVIDPLSEDQSGEMVPDDESGREEADDG